MNDDAVELDVIELEDNLADAEKPPELPAGVYVGQITDVQVAQSQKGNEYYAIKFTVPQEDLPADLQDQFEDGASLYWNRQVKPKKGDRRALFNLRKFIEAIGLDSNTTSINPNEWMGCEARLRVRQTINPKNPSDGKRAEIQSIEAVEGASVQARASVARGRQSEPTEEEEATPARRGGNRRGR